MTEAISSDCSYDNCIPDAECTNANDSDTRTHRSGIAALAELVGPLPADGDGNRVREWQEIEKFDEVSKSLKNPNVPKKRKKKFWRQFRHVAVLSAIGLFLVGAAVVSGGTAAIVGTTIATGYGVWRQPLSPKGESL